MLTQDPFYHSTIRKVVIAFGSMFSDLHITRLDSSGSPAQTLKVPLSYGPKEKYLYRIKQDAMPDRDDQVEMVLPRMSYEVKGFVYDEARKLTSTGRTKKSTSVGGQSAALWQFNPVPYNISIVLDIMVKNLEDGLMIVEQIIPFFTPDYTVSVNDVPDLDLKKDIVFVLNQIISEDTWTENFQDRRTITYTLDFTGKAYLYPPVNTGKIILDARTNLFMFGGDADPVFTVRDVVDPITARKEDAHTIIETTTDTTVEEWLTPHRGILGVNDTKQFTLFGGPSTLTLTPNLGTVSPTGLYTAPPTITENTLVVLRNTINANSTRWSEAFITLHP